MLKTETLVKTPTGSYRLRAKDRAEGKKLHRKWRKTRSEKDWEKLHEWEQKFDSGNGAKAQDLLRGPVALPAPLPDPGPWNGGGGFKTNPTPWWPGVY